MSTVLRIHHFMLFVHVLPMIYFYLFLIDTLYLTVGMALWACLLQSISNRICLIITRVDIWVFQKFIQSYLVNLTKILSGAWFECWVSCSCHNYHTTELLTETFICSWFRLIHPVRRNDLWVVVIRPTWFGTKGETSRSTSRSALGFTS